MLEKIEKFLESIDFKALSMNDLKAYTEIAIAIQQYKESKKFMKNFSNSPEKLVLH